MSNSLSGPSNFADDGSAVIARQIEVHHSKLASKAQDKINACSDIYEIERTVGAIKERGYKRVMPYPSVVSGMKMCIPNALTSGTD